MSAESRTGSGTGPLPKRSRLLTGSATVLLALATLGLANPALAATPTDPSTGDAKVAAGDRCYGYYTDSGFVTAGNGDDCWGKTGPAGPRGPAGPPGPSVCTDIDTTDYFALGFDIEDTPPLSVTLREELSAALLTNGRVFAGQRDLELDGEEDGDYVWDRIDTNPGFPDDSKPCAVSISAPSGGISAIGDTAYVKVLFLDGEVWELAGVRDDPLQVGVFDFSGSTWAEVEEPSGTLKGFKNQKALKGAPKNAR